MNVKPPDGGEDEIDRNIKHKNINLFCFLLTSIFPDVNPYQNHC